MTAQPVRVRMAPSPTGPIHTGNVHTAMFNWLFARQSGGAFVLRFEDTDQARSERRWEEVIYGELRWLGLDWDEAPDRGGDFGPYRQSERLGLYQEWAGRLLRLGAAYECYCTVEEIAAERQRSQAAGRPYQYDRRCRYLDETGRAARRAQGRVPSIRLAVPDDQVVVVDDLVRRRIEFPTSAIGDPIIMRPSGMPLYNFAVVVDDLTMRITHVLRGEGHISNTPLQVLIYQALGEATPYFGHFGHITSDSGAKFSKRHGEGYIGFYREMGILPEAMFNYLALLAWTPGGGREILTPAEVRAEFDLGRVTAAPSQFDPKKLLWVNGHHLRRMTVPQFAAACLPHLVGAGLVAEGEAAAQSRRLEGTCALLQPRVEALSQVVEAASFFWQAQIGYTEPAARMLGRPEAKLWLARSHEWLAALPGWEIPELEAAGEALLAELQLEPKSLYQVIRAAVTGRVASPPLFDTLYWIGRERSLERMARAAGGGELPAAGPA